jgi:hypothetical protein
VKRRLQARHSRRRRTTLSSSRESMTRVSFLRHVGQFRVDPSLQGKTLIPSTCGVARNASRIDFPVHATKSRPPRRVNRESVGNTGSGYFAPPILNIFVPQMPHFPSVAGRPFFMVICTASFISRLLLHFTQYASSGVDIDSSVISRNPTESPAVYSQGARRLLVSVPPRPRVNLGPPLLLRQLGDAKEGRGTQEP